MMTPTERREVSLDFLQRSDHEFNHGGNNMIAAELLWGSVAQVLIAVAEINQWPCKGHRDYGEVAKRIAEQQLGTAWRFDVAAADQLHRHFYNGNLRGRELDSRRFAARRALFKAIPLLPEH